MKSKIITYGVVIVLAVALVSALNAWYSEKYKPVISKVEYVNVPEIKVVTKIKKVEVPMQGNIIAKEKQRSLLGFPNEKEIGMRAGYNVKALPQVSVFGRWSFLRVGNIHLSAYGEGNSEGNATAQLELGYKF